MTFRARPIEKPDGFRIGEKRGDLVEERRFEEMPLVSGPRKLGDYPVEQ